MGKYSGLTIPFVFAPFFIRLYVNSWGKTVKRKLKQVAIIKLPLVFDFGVKKYEEYDYESD